jgi:hypothetical protein
MHLAQLLKARTSLTALGLAWNSISMTGAVQLCDSLAQNSTLKTLVRPCPFTHPPPLPPAKAPAARGPA